MVKWLNYTRQSKISFPLVIQIIGDLSQFPEKVDKTMSVIRILSPEIAALIAAGEVIERPASVVKELVENSLDAGADRIFISTSAGGMNSIVVSDNGKGIELEEVEVAFERHSTSKIYSESDLESIETLGFRGEALYSISSVSQVDVATRARGESKGVRISLDTQILQTQRKR